MMRLYLDENLAKAVTPPSGSGGGGDSHKYKYWGKQGAPPDPENWEQTASGAWRKPIGAGSAQGPSEEPQEQSAEKEQVEPDSEPAQAHAKLTEQSSSQETGSYSTDSSDYDENTDPMDHYNTALFHEKTGHKEGAEGHKDLARERTKDFTSEEHKEIAGKLKASGMHDEAQHHISEAQSKDTEDEIDPPGLLSDELNFGEKLLDITTKYPPAKSGKEYYTNEKQAGKEIAQVYYDHFESEELVEKLRNLEQREEKKGPREQAIISELKKKLRKHGEQERAKQEKEKDTQRQERQQADEEKKGKKRKEKPGSKPSKKPADKKPSKPDDKKPTDDESKGSEDDKKPVEPKEDGPKPPESTFEHAQVNHHTSEANKLVTNIQTHLENSDELSEDERSKLQHTLEALKEHQDIGNVPTKEQKAQLKELKTMVGEHGKQPHAEASEVVEGGGEEDKPAAQQKRKGPSMQSVMEQAGALGSALGHSAASPYGAAGTALEQTVNYGTRGAVRGGHYLLNNKPPPKQEEGAKVSARDQREEQKRQRKQEQMEMKDEAKQGAEQRQSSLGKSLGLYLDLYKAVQQTPNASLDTPTEKQSAKEYESSYAKRPTGVTGGGVNLTENEDDDDDKEWKHSEESSVSSEVDDMLEQEKRERDQEANKSLAIDFVKSLNESIQQELQNTLPSDTEAEFMINVLGHDPKLVKKGLVYIKGKDRHRFNEWAHERLQKSLGSLIGRF